MKNSRIVIGLFCITLFSSAIADTPGDKNMTDKITTVKSTLSADEQYQNNLQQQLKTIEVSLSLINQDFTRINQAAADERFLLKK